MGSWMVNVLRSGLSIFITILVLSCSMVTPVRSQQQTLSAGSSPASSQEQVFPQETVTSTYLPLVRNGIPKFVGIIMKHYWSKDNVEKYMTEADALAGEQHTAVGWFIDVQDPAFYEDWETESALNRNNLYRQLEQLWLKGYISLVKLGSSDTARNIADGVYDDRLNQMAKIYKRWVDKGDGRKAMVAPLQEMNGDWVAYYPKGSSISQKQKDFKDAFRHIQQIFLQNGVDRSQIWWVFAPNGLSVPDVPENGFEYYYPGDDVVDLVGFASYNYGFCEATLKPDGSDYGKWENYDTIYEPYIRRMQKMAPSKPILITETGSSAVSTREEREQRIKNYAKKAEWFVINYGYLAKQPAVLGVFYFDMNEFDGTTCDLRIPRPDEADFQGYRQALENQAFQYLKSTVLDEYIP